MFVRSHAAAYLISLLLCDFFQGPYMHTAQTVLRVFMLSPSGRLYDELEVGYAKGCHIRAFLPSTR